MIEAYNATPENFGVPSDEVINRMIGLIDKQIEIDSLIEHGNGMAVSGTSFAPDFAKAPSSEEQKPTGELAVEESKTHGSQLKWSPLPKSKHGKEKRPVLRETAEIEAL